MNDTTEAGGAGETEEMASGADAEAAAAKLQARMRGKIARTRAAGLREAQEGNSVVEASVNDTTEAGGAGETEEMASGVDAEVAAAKLQARMRGNVARHARQGFGKRKKETQS